MRPIAIACALLLISIAARAQAPSALLLVLNKTDSTLSLIDPRSGGTMGKVPTGANPHEVATSADGRLAITTNYGGDSLSVIDLAARKEVQRVALRDLRQPHGIDFLGGLAVFTAEGNRAIAAYDPPWTAASWWWSTPTSARSRSACVLD